MFHPGDVGDAFVVTNQRHSRSGGVTGICPTIARSYLIQAVAQVHVRERVLEKRVVNSVLDRYCSATAASITCVPDPVTIRIRLTWVSYGRAIIGAVHHTVTIFVVVTHVANVVHINVFLVGIGRLRAIIAAV